MSDVQLIKDRLDVVDFLQEYFPLKQSGNSWKGLCPFHNEKTPSFMVSREKQFWYCFGCSEGGDILSFVQKIEGIEFVEALRLLANRAGVALREYIRPEQTSKKLRILEINTLAASYFQKILLESGIGKPAREYVQNRALREDTILQFQIGYIPNEWDLLTQFLFKKGYGAEEVLESGLTIQKEGGGYYDRFRGRIMFPIHSVHGDIIGFTGRILVEEPERPVGKYVNTPETLVYEKSKVIYGLDKAKLAIKKEGYAIIVEGQMDVIANHQAGFTQTIATSGTAFTEEQLRLLKRYTSTLRISFDMDSAGIAAAKRGIRLAHQAGFDIRVIQIPNGQGKDPDECIRKDGALWRQSVERAVPAMEFYFSMAQNSYTLTEPKEKKMAAAEILNEIKEIESPIEQDYWLQKLGTLLAVSDQAIRDAWKYIKQKQSKKIGRGQENSTHEIKSRSRQEQLSERLLAVVLNTPSLIQTTAIEIPEFLLSTEAYQTIYKSIKSSYTRDSLNPKKSFVDSILDASSDQLKPIIHTLLLYGEKEFFGFTPSEKEKEYILIIQSLKGINLQKKKEELTIAIALAEKNKDTEILEKLLQEYQSLTTL